MKSRILLSFFLMIFLSSIQTSVFAASKYSIKKMTTKVQQALNGRKARFEMIRALKTEGSVGETNDGYLKSIRPGDKVKDIVAQENEDRRIIYKTIIAQNDLRGALDAVEQIFGQEQKERAETGDFIQLEDGSWVQK